MCTSGRDGESHCAFVASSERLSPPCWWLLHASQSRWLVSPAGWQGVSSASLVKRCRETWVSACCGFPRLRCKPTVIQIASCWCVWDKIQRMHGKFFGLSSPHPCHPVNFIVTTSYSLAAEAVCSEFQKWVRLLPLSLWLIFQLDEMVIYFFINVNRLLKRIILKSISISKMAREVLRQVMGTADSLS